VAAGLHGAWTIGALLRRRWIAIRLQDLPDFEARRNSASLVFEKHRLALIGHEYPGAILDSHASHGNLLLMSFHDDGNGGLGID